MQLLGCCHYFGKTIQQDEEDLESQAYMFVCMYECICIKLSERNAGTGTRNRQFSMPFRKFYMICNHLEYLYW